MMTVMTPRFHKETSPHPFTAMFLQTAFKLTELCFRDGDSNVSAEEEEQRTSRQQQKNVKPGNQITSVMRVETLQLLCGLALLHPSLFNHLEPKCLEAAQDRYPHDTRWRTAVTSSSAGFCFLFWDLKPGGRKPVQTQSDSSDPLRQNQVQKPAAEIHQELIKHNQTSQI